VFITFNIDKYKDEVQSDICEKPVKMQEGRVELCFKTFLICFYVMDVNRRSECWKDELPKTFLRRFRLMRNVKHNLKFNRWIVLKTLPRTCFRKYLLLRLVKIK